MRMTTYFASTGHWSSYTVACPHR